MKSIKLTLLLLAVSLTAGAQNEVIERAITEFLGTGFTVSESLTQERDANLPDAPMKSMCAVWDFTCDADVLAYVVQLSDKMKAQSSDPLCYYVKTHTPGREDWHDILVGDDPNQHVDIGRSAKSFYTLISVLDAADATKSHRYCYAVEWQESDVEFKLVEKNGKLTKQPVTDKKYKGKVVMTYARIPKKAEPKVNYDAKVDYDIDVKDFGKLRIANLEEFDRGFTEVEAMYVVNVGLRMPLSRLMYALCAQGSRYATDLGIYKEYGRRLQNLITLSEKDEELESIIQNLEMAKDVIMKKNK